MVYFTNSGSEANDLAVTMAQLYTGAHDIINLRYFKAHLKSFKSCCLLVRNGYHGGSPYTIEMTNLGNWKFNLHRNLGVHAVKLLINKMFLIIVFL